MDGPPISFSLAGLHAASGQRAGPWAGGVRAAIAWASGVGFRSVHLDAAAPQIRPRSLDRSGRRDLAATLRREGAAFTGLDLWIPPEHFGPGANADRAHAALLDALVLAGELAGLCAGAASLPVVSVTLPENYEGLPEAVARSDALGVLIEDFGAAVSVGSTLGEEHRDPAAKAGTEAGASPGPPPVAVRPGIDTGRLLLRDRPPGKAFAASSAWAATLRLNDADDTGRRPMGSGRLDLPTLLALHATLTPSIPIVTDARGLEDPARAAHAAAERIPASMLPGMG